ncbi:M48 family metallopeptidase [Flavobacteriales bacterium]|nr:M48 family metallopeptidase [Flavobacteriales bacterium]
MTKKEHIDGIGEVTFVKTKRTKNLRISMSPYKGVRVSVPYLMSFRKAFSFVIEKQDWIHKHLPEMERKLEGQTVFDENTDFNTYRRKLVIIIKPNIKVPRAKLLKEKILVEFPESLDIYTEQYQDFIRTIIEETWRKEAKELLPIRTSELATKFNLSYEKVSVKNTKSRWGSCSHQNNISLSLHLMRLPKELRDYVILHELAHTVEKNHQPPFWNFLDTLTEGNAKKLDKELKNYTTRIF